MRRLPFLPSERKKELNVQHMGQPGEGMPVAGMGGGQSPFDIFQAQTGFDMQIVCNVLVVVETNKIVVLHLPISSKGCHNEKQTDYGIMS